MTRAKHHLIIGGCYAAATMVFVALGAAGVFIYALLLVALSVWGAMVGFTK